MNKAKGRQPSCYAEVCSRHLGNRRGAFLCHPHGNACEVEQHLPELLSVCRTMNTALIDPYINKLYKDVCSHCVFERTAVCPCPLDYLLALTTDAIAASESQRTLNDANDRMSGCCNST